MDNASVVDGVLLLVLLVGVFVGAKRGFFKSLMGLVVVVAAIFGSLWLANLLTDPITDVVAPKVEDAAVKKYGELFEATVQEGSAQARESLEKLLEKYHIGGSKAADSLLRMTESAPDSEKLREKAEETFRGVISDSLRKAVRGTVHTVLVLVCYIVLLFLLKLLTRTLDHIFDLPVLSTVNGVGGAVLGLLEAAALLFVVVRVAYGFHVPLVTEHVNDTRLLPLFLNDPPIEQVVSVPQ